MKRFVLISAFTAACIGLAGFASLWAANETDLAVYPDHQEIGKTVTVSITCDSGGIRVEGNVGYFVTDSGTKGMVGGGGRGAYCGPPKGQMTAKFLCTGNGIADFTYGADHAYLACGTTQLVSNAAPPAPPATVPAPAQTEAQEPAAQAPIPSQSLPVLRAPNTGSGGLVRP